MLRWSLGFIALSCLWQQSVAQRCCDCWMDAANVHDPMLIDLSAYNEFFVYGYDCGLSETYYWRLLSSSFERLYDLGTTTQPSIKLQPFTFRYDRNNRFNNLVVEVIKRDFDGEGSCRSYIKLINLHIFADIVGGERRLIGEVQSLTLKSAGYDETQPANAQRFYFRWRCSSTTDKISHFCITLDHRSHSLTIPGGYFRIHNSYVIELILESVATGYRARATQTIEVTYGTFLPMEAICRQNCFGNMFNPGIAINVRFNCVEFCHRPYYEIYMEDEIYMKNSTKSVVIVMPPDKETFTMRCKIYDIFQNSTGDVIFHRNTPPSGGNCTVTPTSGVAVATIFQISCDGYTDENQPIKYALTAGNMVFKKKTWAHWRTHLPMVKALHMRICDSLKGCIDVEIPVELKPVEIPKDLPNLNKFLKNDTFNIDKKLKNGDLTTAVIIGSAIIKQSKATKTFEKVVKSFTNYNVSTVRDVRQLTTMASELTEPMLPLNSEKAEIVGTLFNKVTEGFEAIIKDGEIRYMSDEDFKKMSEEMIGMIEQFSKKAEDLPDIRSITWEYESEFQQLADAVAAETPPRHYLVEHYAKLDHFNETVLQKINRWEHVISKAFEVLYDIGLAGASALLTSEENFIVDGLSNDVRMVTLRVDEVDQNITLVSLDQFSTAELSVNVLHEMQREIIGPDTLLQLVSFKQNPFWWLPVEYPITTSVFYFSAFSQEELENRRTYLEEPVIIRMQQTNPPKNPITHHGTLNNASMMIMYQSRLQPGAGYRVLFTELSASVHVGLSCGLRPTVSQVRSTTPLSAKQEVYKLNKHEDERYCYVALMTEKSATGNVTYTFEVRIYECLTWRRARAGPTWTTRGCEAYIDPKDADNITCNCYHLSIFAGRTHYTYFEETIRDRNIMKELPTNWYMVFFYIVLILLFVLLFLKAYCDLTSNVNVLVTELPQAEDTPCKSILYISTGSQWTAGTTANVTITFTTGLFTTNSFTIYQDPGNPKLVPGSTRELQLPVRVKDLRQPLQLTLSHDNGGRYPTWYCSSIRLKDMETDEQHEFQVKKWISTQTVKVQAVPQKDLASMTSAETKEKFCKYFGDFFILLFMFQPLCGPTRAPNIDLPRFERTCIWCTKLAVMLLIIVLCFGDTDLDDVENEREWYEFIINRLDVGLLLCVACYFAGLLIELIILVFLYPTMLERCWRNLKLKWNEFKEKIKGGKENQLRKKAKREKAEKEKAEKEKESMNKEKQKAEAEAAERERQQAE